MTARPTRTGAFADDGDGADEVGRDEDDVPECLPFDDDEHDDVFDDD